MKKTLFSYGMIAIVLCAIIHILIPNGFPLKAALKTILQTRWQT